MILKIILLLLGILFFSGCKKENEKFTKIKCQKKDFIKVIPCVGTLKSKDEQIISAPFSSQITWLIPEGTLVKKNEIIAKLSTEEMENELEEIELKIKIQKKEVELNKISHQFELNKYINKKKSLKLSLDSEKLSLEQLKNSIDPAKLKELNLSIKYQLEKIEQLKKVIKSSRILSKKGFLSSYKIKENELNYENSIIELKTLKNNLELLKKTPSKTNLEDQKFNLYKAETAYNKFLNTFNAYEKNREINKELNEYELNSLKKKKKYYNDLIKKATIRSSIPGIVIYEKTWISNSEQEKVSIGSNVWENWDFLNVSRLDNMQLKINLTEVDIPLLKNKMKIKFALDSDPEKFFYAKISKISKYASFSKRDVNSVKNFKIYADIIKTNKSFKPGMTISGKIIIKKLNDVLVIPNNAIINKNKVIISNNKIKKIKILDSNYFYSVISGLTENETIFIKEPQFSISPKNRKKEKVKKRDIRQTINDIGILEAIKQKFISAKISGKLKFLADEGKNIKKGDIIAKIDVSDIEDKLKTDELNLKMKETDIKLLKEERKNAIYKMKQELKIRDIDVKIAKLDYDKTLSPPTNIDIKNALLTFKSSELSLEKIKKELKLKKKLNKKGFISEKQINEINLRYNKLYIELTVAKINFELKKMGSSFKTKEKARMRYEREKLNWEQQNKLIQNTELNYNIKLEKLEFELNNIKHRIDSKLEKIKLANMTSPINGVIVYLKKGTQEGIKKIKSGDQVYKGTAILKIANIDDFKINGKISEEELSNLSISQEVEFYLSTYPDKKYYGKVKSIGLFAENDWDGGQNSSKIFETEISINKTSPKFQPNMSVKFTIIVNKVENVISISRNSLFFENKKYFVFMNNGKKRYVKPGLKGNEYVEIKKGLNLSDIILSEKKEIEIKK